MQYRCMTVDDYESVYKLWCATPNMGLNDKDDAYEGIEKYLQRNPTTCFVAEENEKLCGVIMAGHDGRRGFIYRMAVAQDRQRQGIGERLLAAAIHALEAEGIHKVGLLVFAQNEIGNGFWEKQGFANRTDVLYRNKVIQGASEDE